ncbi:MAG: methylamine utilization protein MauE [bacterium]|nr:methylamine utilization protein MauE [bacterium]
MSGDSPMLAMDPAFAWIARLGLALLFGAAARHKLSDPRAFLATLRDYRIVPASLVKISALVIAASEIAAIGLLLLPGLGLGPLLAIGLLAVYSLAIALNLLRGRRHIDCGCLGPAHRQELSGWLLVRNSLLGTGSLVLLAAESARTLSWIDALSIGGGLCMLILLWNAAHQLGSVPSSFRTPESSS